MRHLVRVVPLVSVLAAALALAPMSAQAQRSDLPTIHAATTLGLSNNDRASRDVPISSGLIAEVEMLTIEMRLPFWTLLGEPVLNPVARWRWEEGARIHLRGGPNNARLVTFILDENADEIGIYDGGLSVTVPREVFERHARLIDFHYLLMFADLEAVGPTPEGLMRSYSGVLDQRPDQWGWNVAGSPNWAELIARSVDGVPEPGRPPERGYLSGEEARRVFELQMRQCAANAPNRPLPMAPERCEANGNERFLPYGLHVSMMGLIWETQRRFPEWRELIWPQPRDRQVVALAGALAGRADEQTPRRAELLRRTVDTFRDELDPTSVALAEAELERVGTAEVGALENDLRVTAEQFLADAEAGAVEDATYERLVALRERAATLPGRAARRVVAQARGLERLGSPVVWVEVEFVGHNIADYFALGFAQRDGDGGKVTRARHRMSVDPPNDALFYDPSGRPDTVDVAWSVASYYSDGSGVDEYIGNFAVPFHAGEVAVVIQQRVIASSFEDFDGRAVITWGPCSATVYEWWTRGIRLGGPSGTEVAAFHIPSRGQPQVHPVDGPSDCVLHSGTGAIWFDPFAGSGR